jgi:hypothetical protein
MNEKLTELRRRVTDSATSVAKQTIESATAGAKKAKESVVVAVTQVGDFVQTHKPTEEDLGAVQEFAVRTSKAAGESIVETVKELAESKTVQDAVKGAGAGALLGVPAPIIGPLAGGAIGAGVAIYLSLKYRKGVPPVLEKTDSPRDLLEELRKLNELRKDGAVTEEQFASLRQKMLDSST